MSSLCSLEILMLHIVALYFRAVLIISFSHCGIDSACGFICHDWMIHSLAVGLSSLCRFMAHRSSSSLATHAHSGLSGSGRHHLLSHPILMASYLNFTLGAPIPPSETGRIALSHTICPLRPPQMKEIGYAGGCGLGILDRKLGQVYICSSRSRMMSRLKKKVLYICTDIDCRTISSPIPQGRLKRQNPRC